MSIIALVLSATIAVSATLCPPELPSIYRSSSEKYTSVNIQGFNTFCDRETLHPICIGNPGKRLTFQEVKNIDEILRSEFVYRSDRAVHGVDDFYTTKILCGDCEDYALILASRLARAGMEGESMALTTWLPTLQLGHATLIVKTSDYGWVEVGVGALETPEVLSWSKAALRSHWMLMDGKKKWLPGNVIPK